MNLPLSILPLIFLVLALGTIGCRPDSYHHQELSQEVIGHYEQTGDSLKLEAARFLLSHMDRQAHRTNPKTQMLIDSLYGTEGIDRLTLEAHVRRLAFEWDSLGKSRKATSISGAEAVSASELIQNIDLAFAAWEATPWKDQYSFDIFCNYVLPYHVGNGPYQDGWREFYYNELSWLRDSIATGLTPAQAIRMLKDSSRGSYRYIGLMPADNCFGAIDLWHTQAGDCVNSAQWYLLACRSAGIPTTLITPKQWANHNGGHIWLGGPDTTGNFVSYNINLSVHGLLPAKVYTDQYDANPASFEMSAGDIHKADLPRAVKGYSKLDITTQFIPATDVAVKLFDDIQPPNPFVFLSIFHIRKWAPIHWARHHDGEAIFNDMGLQAVYLPSYYADKTNIPAGNPVIVNMDSSQYTVELDTSEWLDVRLTRKYPLRSGMYHYCKHLIKSSVEGASSREFTDAAEFYQIPRAPGDLIKNPRARRDRIYYHEYWDSVVLDQPVEYQYVRLRADSIRDCFIGELEFYTPGGDRITGDAFGNSTEPDRIHDGYYGEAYRDREKGSWVGIDFGSTQQIGKIRWLPSNDSNSIQTGDEYELMYWDGHQWVSLGKQIASSPVLNYRVPIQALLWLRCLSRGDQERPFLYDEDTGLQIFY